MKASAVLCLAIGLLAGLAQPAAAGQGDDPGGPGSRAAKPGVVCLNSATGSFSRHARPEHCAFYDAAAPGPKVNPGAAYRTRAVRWSHWGHSTAVGRGEYRVSGKWLPVRLKLIGPEVACGERVFTRVRMDLKVCVGRWTGWERPIKIERCL